MSLIVRINGQVRSPAEYLAVQRTKNSVRLWYRIKQKLATLASLQAGNPAASIKSADCTT